MTGNAYADMICQALEKRGLAMTVFSGRSMAPTLTAGMLVRVKKSAPDDVRRADIIFYRRAGQTVAHRVIGVSRDEDGLVFVTKGDNQIFIAADRVPERNFIGVVDGAFRADEPQKDLLVRSPFIGASYAAFGNLAEYAVHRRASVPALARTVFRHGAAAFFLAFKRSIHITYMGMRNVHLLSGRYDKRPRAV